MDENQKEVNTEEITEIPKLIDVSILNIDSVVFEGKAKMITAPGPMGDFAILPGHTPLITKLEPGVIIVEKEDGERKELEIKGAGIAKVDQFTVKILMGF
jgi:F-type H+-transporting ATPase subunit epsilon